MFITTLQPNMNCCFSNPFAAGCMPFMPRFNFFMNMAVSTSMPAFPYLTMNTPYYYPMSSYSLPMYGTISNPFTSYNYNNIFNYSSVNTYNCGIGSVTPWYFNYTPYVPSFSSFQFSSSANPFRINTSSASRYAASSSVSSQVSEYNPQGVKLNKNKGKYGKDFLKKVKAIAKRLNCNYRDLLAVMNAESGIKADAKNPNSSATGLIQFMESTAHQLGTTTAALRQMSPLQQLDYVEKYLQNAKRAAGFHSSHKLSGGELYALVFLPARAGREVLASSGENYYACNKGLDKNRDGKITKSELNYRVKSHYVSDNSFLA